mmetsp:Transcript_39262/g.73664  ORF Transcript_39262/g.73664 Transcript_39262/m.73664 type:complete len:529 (-) Transcript_39262:812-2398(-)
MASPHKMAGAYDNLEHTEKHMSTKTVKNCASTSQGEYSSPLLNQTHEHSASPGAQIHGMEEDTVTHSQSIKVELMMNSSTGSSHQPEASPTCETPPLKMVAGRSDESLRAADQPCTSSHKNVCEGFAAHTGTILVKKKNRGCMPYGGFMPSICCPCKSPSGEVQFPAGDDFPHICFLVNKRSGGGLGERIMLKLKSLPQCSVIDVVGIAEQGSGGDGVEAALTRVLHEQSKLARATRVVAAGGDGTVSWAAVLLTNACAHLSVDPAPLCAMPLGTGNEVSRCTGWGAAHAGRGLNDFLQQVVHNRTVPMDLWRWSCSGLDAAGQHKSGKGDEQRLMMCFFSAGFDASIAHRFHEMRERKGAPSSVQANKLWHVWFGLVEGLVNKQYVKNWMELHVDGRKVDLPKRINTVQVMNIHSSADGIDFFGIGQRSTSNELQQYSEPMLGDGLLEVVGTTGVSDLLAIRTRVKHSVRLAQGSHIELVIKRRTPAQLDGEPRMLDPCRITIAKQNVKQPVVVGPGVTKGIPKLNV